MYTKHQWKANVYYNFGYAQYLPKDYDDTKNIPSFSFSTAPESEERIWIFPASTAI